MEARASSRSRRLLSHFVVPIDVDDVKDLNAIVSAYAWGLMMLAAMMLVLMALMFMMFETVMLVRMLMFVHMLMSMPLQMLWFRNLRFFEGKLKMHT